MLLKFDILVTLLELLSTHQFEFIAREVQLLLSRRLFLSNAIKCSYFGTELMIKVVGIKL